MHLIDVTKRFQTNDSCLEYLAELRWPKGITCQKCGVIGNDEFRKFKTNETKRLRFSKKLGKTVEKRVPARSLFECKHCGYQFSATAGTVFHNSHLPLEKWFQAIALIIDAKKGMSALQVCRHSDSCRARIRKSRTSTRRSGISAIESARVRRGKPSSRRAQSRSG